MSYSQLTKTKPYFTERVRGGALRTRAGGDVMSPEHTGSAMDLSQPYTAPTNLVLTPAPECKSTLKY